MEINALKKQIESSVGWDAFEDEMYDEFSDYDGKFEEKLGLKVEFVEITECYDGQPFKTVFKIDDRFYCLDGYSSSWDSNSYDSVEDFYEVVKQPKVIEEWVNVKRI